MCKAPTGHEQSSDTAATGPTPGRRPKVVCKVQTKPCPADCKQKMMCEKEGDYA